MADETKQDKNLVDELRTDFPEQMKDKSDYEVLKQAHQWYGKPKGEALGSFIHRVASANTEDPGLLRSGIQGFSDTATFGTAPMIQAAGDKALGQDFVPALRKRAIEQDYMAEQNPASYMGGQVAGVLPALATGILSGGTAPAAEIGAGMAARQAAKMSTAEAVKRGMVTGALQGTAYGTGTAMSHQEPVDKALGTIAGYGITGAGMGAALPVGIGGVKAANDWAVKNIMPDGPAAAAGDLAGRAIAGTGRATARAAVDFTKGAYEQGKKEVMDNAWPFASKILGDFAESGVTGMARGKGALESIAPDLGRYAGQAVRAGIGKLDDMHPAQKLEAFHEWLRGTGQRVAGTVDDMVRDMRNFGNNGGGAAEVVADALKPGPAKDDLMEHAVGRNAVAERVGSFVNWLNEKGQKAQNDTKAWWMNGHAQHTMDATLDNIHGDRAANANPAQATYPSGIPDYSQQISNFKRGPNVPEPVMGEQPMSMIGNPAAPTPPRFNSANELTQWMRSNPQAATQVLRQHLGTDAAIQYRNAQQGGPEAMTAFEFQLKSNPAFTKAFGIGTRQ